MAQQLETVLIQHPQDPTVAIRINICDLQPEMVLWQLPPVEPPSSPKSWTALFTAYGWRAVKESAAVIGYEKPEGLTWEDAVVQLEASYAYPS